MIARVVATAIVFLLAVVAFWDDALGAGHVFNPFGILLLFLAGLTWLAWGTIRDAFVSAKQESNLPIVRLGSAIIKGMENLKHAPRPRRSSSG
jgi:hypothetical protein